ncbi:MAG: DUF115 domain-containing protein [Acidobacteria bacterium]|nr:DUF115 domain-containing protein [Acidobacteriota bacterium]
MAHATTAPSSVPAPPLVFIGADASPVAAALGYAPDTRVVVFAPDQAAAQRVRAALAGPGASAADRLSVLVGPDYAGAAQVAAGVAGLSSARIMIDPRLEQDRPGEVQRARAALSKLTFQSSANDGARRASAGRYLLHTLANAPRLAREADVASLAGLFEGIPAVIVAAGPSLDRNIRDLMAVRDRVLIIACDTAARPLLSVGLDPHFVVGADSSRANAVHLSALPPSRAWLVAEGSLHPSAFMHFDQRTFVFRVADHHPWPWLQSIGVAAARLDTWGSVATSAFSLARALGCGPIALVGADFAFTDGRPYARGTSFESQWACWHAAGSSYEDIWRLLRDRWASVTIETAIDGSPVATAPHLLSFRDWVNERAAEAPGLRVINATGAGLLAGPAIEQRPLVDALGAADTIDRALIDRLLSAAHQHTRGDMTHLLAAIPALAEGNDETIPLWLEFAGGTASLSAITAALRSPEYAAWTIGRQGRLVTT